MLTPDEATAELNAFEESVIVLESAAGMGEPPAAVLLLAVSDPAWDREWPVEILRRAMSEEGAPPAFELRVHRDYFEWGASASTAEVALTVASWAAQGIVGVLGWKAVSRAFDAIVDRIRTGGERTFRDRFPNNEEARYRAAWLVVSRFDLAVEPQDLILVREEEDLSQARFEFSFDGPPPPATDPSASVRPRNRYNVELSTPGGYFELCKMVREA